MGKWEPSQFLIWSNDMKAESAKVLLYEQGNETRGVLKIKVKDQGNGMVQEQLEDL